MDIGRRYKIQAALMMRITTLHEPRVKLRVKLRTKLRVKLRVKPRIEPTVKPRVELKVQPRCKLNIDWANRRASRPRQGRRNASSLEIK